MSVRFYQILNSKGLPRSILLTREKIEAVLENESQFYHAADDARVAFAVKKQNKCRSKLSIPRPRIG